MFSKLSEVSFRILSVVSKTMEFAHKQSYCNIAIEIEKAARFSKSSEVSSRILGVVSKTMELARKQGYCNIGLKIEKAACST